MPARWIALSIYFFSMPAAFPQAVPFRLEGGLITVEARIGGGGARCFVVDTGAEETILCKHAAKKAGISLNAREPVQGVNGLIDARRSEAVAISLGGCKVLTKPLLTLDLSGESRALGIRIDGLLGADLFHGRIIHINFKTRRLDLAAGSDPAAGATILPMSRNYGAMCVRMNAHGASLARVRIDTGCYKTLCWVAPQSSRIGRPWRKWKPLDADLGLGSLELPGIPTVLYRNPIFTGEDGLLGIGLLAGFDGIRIDSVHQRIAFEGWQGLPEE